MDEDERAKLMSGMAAGVVERLRAKHPYREPGTLGMSGAIGVTCATGPSEPPPSGDNWKTDCFAAHVRLYAPDNSRRWSMSPQLARAIANMLLGAADSADRLAREDPAEAAHNIEQLAEAAKR
jgi:hypothetical protein